MLTRLIALSLSGTVIDVAPTDEAGAVAVVTIDNAMTNGPHDNGTYALPFEGQVIGVTFTWDASMTGADRITVTPPAGMTCIPADCTATVIEGQAGRVLLMPWVGM